MASIREQILAALITTLGSAADWTIRLSQVGR